ncbi:YhbY family RNA-binding protein [Candidatus Thorarchaeota archaeon]|nr:MAG: YhbY family RNA-binding protein [Candidatus Thorarchaeota archaeon]
MIPMKPDSTRVSIVWQEPAMMQIGKSGLSAGVIKEVKRLLKTHKCIKVRLLRSALSADSKENLFSELCDAAGAHLDSIRGNTAVIYKMGN